MVQRVLLLLAIGVSIVHSCGASGEQGGPACSRGHLTPGDLGLKGNGGEIHQVAESKDQILTTDQGIPVSDNQNTLKYGSLGSALLEDFVFREKMMHFDHERIPDRVVHARGTGVHGYFQPTKAAARYSKAAFLQDPTNKTEVFVRFSTVLGNSGSIDLPRDVRGFAVKFYTEEGIFDLVGNNIPVFFIQDAIKFPDLVHAARQEQDRAMPAAATAHDTFWDFISLMPESMHMIMWAMSDRAIPRSFRMMEGFGVHTFRLINKDGESTFVKFHWRPTIGSSSVVWDEAVKISGADPDFLRRDLWEAIDQGDFPEFTLNIQAFDQKVADSLPFDVLDSTKIIPEELVPLVEIGRMVLNRNVDNFFAETEQVAFHPGNIVPGIDFTEDPLLMGRLFSYLDTQLLRLGGPNFHELPINRPRCPIRNLNRAGFMRHRVDVGRVAYEPSNLDPDGPRESPQFGFRSFRTPVSSAGSEPVKLRIRPESFADHYSQARLFYRSQTLPEQRHIIDALNFELSRVDRAHIRQRMLAHLAIIDEDLGQRVAARLGMTPNMTITPAREPIELSRSPALSILAKAPETVQGRKVGIVVTDGTDHRVVDAVRKAAEHAGARVNIIAPKIGGAIAADGKTHLDPDFALHACHSGFFDMIVLAPSKAGAQKLATIAGALNFVNDAFNHLKVIGYTPSAQALMERTNVIPDDGVIDVGDTGKNAGALIARATKGRVFDREPRVHETG